MTGFSVIFRSPQYDKRMNAMVRRADPKKSPVAMRAGIAALSGSNPLFHR